jgi:hypothetical protein
MEDLLETFNINLLKNKISKFLIIGNSVLSDEILNNLLDNIYEKLLTNLNYIRRGLIFTENKELFESKTEISTIYDKINISYIETFINTQKYIVSKYLYTPLLYKTDSLIIFDNILGNKFKEPDIRYLFLNGRSCRINSIIYMDTYQLIPPQIRHQFNFLIIINDLIDKEINKYPEEYENKKKNKMENRKNLYIYFFGFLDSFDNFNKYLDKLFETNNYLLLEVYPKNKIYLL